MCVVNMVFNMVSEQAIAGPTPNWVSHLCLFPVHICKYSWCFCSILESFCSSDFAAFRNFILEKEQHSEIGSIPALVLKKNSTAHLKVFILNFLCNFCSLKSAVWSAAGILFKLDFWRSLWVFYSWNFLENYAFSFSAAEKINFSSKSTSSAEYLEKKSTAILKSLTPLLF